MQDSTRDFVGGFVAGAANVVSGYPFDTCKVRLQASAGLYHGLGDVLRSVLREEGVRGLFRGLSSPLVGGAAETAVNYLVYSRVLQALRGEGEDAPSLRHVPLAAACAGAALSFILGPTELIKCRMQMGQAPSISACVRGLLRQEGAGGLTRGLGATLMREIPGNAIFFTVYEALRRALPGRPLPGHGSRGSDGSGGAQPRPALAAAEDLASAVLCGGTAGVVMWTTVLPLDVAKTRIQTAHKGGHWDQGVAAHLSQMWREGGRRALWAGLAPTLVRAFPANACQWVAWELAMRYLPRAEHTPEAGVKAAASQPQQHPQQRPRQQPPQRCTDAAAVTAPG